MSDLDHEIEPCVDPAVARGLAEVGRTEDLRFSPDGRRIAIAGFARRTVVLVDVEVTGASGAVPTVTIDGLVVAATDLAQPHGLDWLDAETLVVGDRDGGVALIGVPPGGPGVHSAQVSSRPIPGSDRLLGPGSVAVVEGTDGPPEVLVCCNWANEVVRLSLGDESADPVDAEVWLRRGLDLPDGVAVSSDGRWVAVSNHDEQQILVYDRAAAVRPVDRAPAGVLRGTRYPHGLRFTADGGHLLVADAGAPVVHVYGAGDDGWQVAGYPLGAVRVVPDAAFRAGHHRHDEGGPKGIDLDPSGRLLAVTTEHRPLGFVDLAAALRRPPPIDPEELAAYERSTIDRVTATKAARGRAEHDALAAERREHEARALAHRTEGRAEAAEVAAGAAHADAASSRQRAEAAEHRAADAEDHLAAIQATRLWRVADRPRRLYARLRARRP